MTLFKDPEAACKLFIAKMEALGQRNRELRIINGELIRLLEKHNIDYEQTIKNIDFGEPSDGALG